MRCGMFETEDGRRAVRRMRRSAVLGLRRVEGIPMGGCVVVVVLRRVVNCTGGSRCQSRRFEVDCLGFACVCGRVVTAMVRMCRPAAGVPCIDCYKDPSWCLSLREGEYLKVPRYLWSCTGVLRAASKLPERFHVREAANDALKKPSIVVVRA